MFTKTTKQLSKPGIGCGVDRLSRPFYQVLIINWQKVKELEIHGADASDLEKLGTGKLRAAAVEGDVENGSVMMGQLLLWLTG